MFAKISSRRVTSNDSGLFYGNVWMVVNDYEVAVVSYDETDDGVKIVGVFESEESAQSYLQGLLAASPIFKEFQVKHLQMVYIDNGKQKFLPYG